MPKAARRNYIPEIFSDVIPRKEILQTANRHCEIDCFSSGQWTCTCDCCDRIRKQDIERYLIALADVEYEIGFEEFMTEWRPDYHH